MRAYVVAAFVFAFLNAGAPAFAAPQLSTISGPVSSVGAGLPVRRQDIPDILGTDTTSSSASSTTGTTTSTATETTSSSTTVPAIIKRQGGATTTITTTTTATANVGLPSVLLSILESNEMSTNNPPATTITTTTTIESRGETTQTPAVAMMPNITVLSGNAVLSNNSNNTMSNSSLASRD